MADSLKEYKNKRHFDKTGEPRAAKQKKSSGKLHFVVQHHIASRDHYDFRLEWDGVLKSWAVPKGPSYDSHDKRLAVQVEDHPLDYRNFEGTIPKGQYGGGVVMIWDEGEWRPTGDAALGLADGSLKFILDGDRLQGAWALVRMKPKDGEKNVNWLLIKEKDEYENAFDPKKFQTSSRTGRSMDEIQDNAAASPGEERKKQEDAPVKAPGKAKQKGADVAKDVKITHAEKILFKEPGISKGDVAAYYTAVANQMLPYVENRILSVVRCPGGIETSCFYKKHPSGDSRGVASFPVPGKDGVSEDYFYVPDSYGLLSEVQMNTLEFHTWGSRVETLEQPDIMVFDLDPDESMGLDQIRQGVRDLKGILDQIGLVSYLKTSGGKGYHVVIPLKPAADWERFHDFARNLAKTMEAAWPERYTSNVRKESRNGRIFIDWMRNGRGATSVAPYSIRAREGAPVSMPISWDELNSVAPKGVTIKEAVRRLGRKNPWAGFFDNRQQLK